MDAAGIASDVARIEAKTEGYQERAHASNTRRAYKADWEHFEAWCTLRDTWRGIRRTHGVASHGKVPTVTEELRALVSTLDLTKAIGIRNRALLLLGFARCYRRSELISIDHEQVAEHRDGLVISLQRSQTDQDGQGSENGIPYGQHPETCPVRAL